MKSFDFDREINRRGTRSTKWEFKIVSKEVVNLGDPDPDDPTERLLPLWVADMDFQSPPAVIDALVERARHGIFGYARQTAAYYDAIIGWSERHYGWRYEADWVATSPGVIPALSMAIQAFTSPGDKVLIQRPVYHPCTYMIEENDRVVASNSLALAGDRYSMDFDNLARLTADPGVKLAVLCNPHNPVGRLWGPAELRAFGEICLANDVYIVADEIHCDLLMPGHTFTPFASLDPSFARNSLTCMAPSKTFNLAGTKLSHIIIPDQDQKAKFVAAQRRAGTWGVGNFALAAAEAAYTHGDAWLDELRVYLARNYELMKTYFAEHMPQIKVFPLEGTFLVWVDFRALGLSSEARKTLMMEKAHVYLDEGELFGPEGEGFERFNIACPRHILLEALQRICREVSQLEL